MKAARKAAATRRAKENAIASGRRKPYKSPKLTSHKRFQPELVVPASSKRDKALKALKELRDRSK